LISLFVKINPPKTFKRTEINEELEQYLPQEKYEAKLNTFYLLIIEAWEEYGFDSVRNLMGHFDYDNCEESYIVNMF